MDISKFVKYVAKTLKKPLVVLDTETTGVDTNKDEIVTFAAIKIFQDGMTQEFKAVCKPSFPIPAEASKVHGITNKDVADKPAFADVSFGIVKFLKGADIAGFNVNYDLRILKRQLEEAGIKDGIKEGVVYDAFPVFKDQSPRNLTAAVKFYTNEEIDDAHDALGDVKSTIGVIAKQIEKDGKDIYTLSEKKDKSKFSHIIVENGKEVLNFGKLKGTPMEKVDKGFIRWVVNHDFPREVKDIMNKYL